MLVPSLLNLVKENPKQLIFLFLIVFRLFQLNELTLHIVSVSRC